MTNHLLQLRDISHMTCSLAQTYPLTRWTLSVLDPIDFRRPPDLPPESAGFGTAVEKRLSSSETSNSDTLH